VAAILLPSLTRLAVSVTGTTGSRDVRERLRLAEAENLGLSEAMALGVQIDDLAGLLARR
jgi:hypothetical protein